MGGGQKLNEHLLSMHVYQRSRNRVELLGSSTIYFLASVWKRSVNEYWNASQSQAAKKRRKKNQQSGKLSSRCFCSLKNWGLTFHMKGRLWKEEIFFFPTCLYMTAQDDEMGSLLALLYMEGQMNRGWRGAPWHLLGGEVQAVIPLFERDLGLWNLYFKENKAKIQVASCKFKVFCVFC